MDPSRVLSRHDGEDRFWSARNGPEWQVARETLFARHEQYARGIARRWFGRRGRGEIDFGDVYQLACEGLITAIDRFDHSRMPLAFRAYAGRCIEGCITSGMARSTELRDQRSTQARIRSERLRSLKPQQVRDTDEALDALTELAVGLALGFMLEDSGVPLETAERLASGPSAYDQAVWSELVARLTDALGSLPERERKILNHHYQLGMSFDALAALLGVSKGRISQLHRGALSALRRRLTARGHFGIEI